MNNLHHVRHPGTECCVFVRTLLSKTQKHRTKCVQASRIPIAAPLRLAASWMVLVGVCSALYQMTMRVKRDRPVLFVHDGNSSWQRKDQMLRAGNFFLGDILERGAASDRVGLPLIACQWLSACFRCTFDEWVAFLIDGSFSCINFWGSGSLCSARKISARLFALVFFSPSCLLAVRALLPLSVSAGAVFAAAGAIAACRPKRISAAESRSCLSKARRPSPN